MPGVFKNCSIQINAIFIAYVAYLVFQLFSHTHLYHDRHNKQSVRFSLKPLALEKKTLFSSENHKRTLSSDSITLGSRINEDFISPEIIAPRQGYTPPRGFSIEPTTGGHVEDASRLNTAVTDMTLVDNISDSYHTALEDHVNTTEDHDTMLKPAGKQPRISVFLTVLLLIVVTGVSVCSSSIHQFVLTAIVLCMYLGCISYCRNAGQVNGRDEYTHQQGVGCFDITTCSYFSSRLRLHLAALRRLTFCAESMTAINVSVKDKLSLSISIAVGGALVSLCETFMDTYSRSLSKPLYSSFRVYRIIHCVAKC